MKWIEKSRLKHGDRYDYSRGVYVNALTKIEIVCPHHGSFWQTPASHYSNGSGCPSCAGRPNIDTTRFIKSAQNVHGDRYGYTKVVYINNNTHVTIDCPDHGEFSITPRSHIHKKRGCAKCSDSYYELKSNDYFITELQEVHGNRYDYSAVLYTGAHTNISVICPDHGPFEQIAREHLLGRNCPTCVGGIPKPWIYYEGRFRDTHGSRYTYDETSFINSHTPMRIECSLHGWFDQAPYAHYGGQGCPVCGRVDSQPEIDIKTFIESLGVVVHNRDRKLIAPFEIDLHMPAEGLAIEYCGLYWHGEGNGKSKTYHLDKMHKVEDAGYRLLTIFEDEWLERPSVVKSVIRNQLMCSERGVGARSLTIVEIDSKTGRRFLDQHHLIGPCNGSVWMGAMDGDKLVALMVFGRPTRQTSSYQWELMRFVTDGRSFPGISTRLFKSFIRQYKPNTVVSFSDRRWFSGRMYENLGFVNDGTIAPDYSYTRRGKRFHKSSKRRSRLLKELNREDGGQSERVMAQELGYDRIWDCGKIRYTWTKLEW